MIDTPILNKQTLFELLSKRFDKEEKKLSQIPSPSLLQDAQKSASRIAEAILKKQKITLVGDYDVDGVSSTAIVVDFFRQIPYPLEAIIPNRFRDGYGVSPNVLKRIDTDLVITVDNGITAVEAAKICKERNIDLIITDHHTPSEVLPDAFAIVDPKLSTCSYPFTEICGAQVAWLLMGLIKKELALKIDMKQFLDILAIAIIADIMPLININRTLVKEGLKVLSTSKRPSSIIIRDFLNRSVISSEDIAFQIAPRINAAGRLEDASIALEFYTAKDTNTAYRQFEKLNALNEMRKETEAETTKEALSLASSDNLVNVVYSEGWHEGVVGIVAARLVEHYQKPAIVLSCENGVAKGSARSIGDVNIYELIKENESYLSKFGGHKMAAGLGLDENSIDDFKNAINISASKIDKNDFIPKEDIVGILPSHDIDFDLLKLQDSFEPYGEANLRPIFLVKNADILEVKLFGKDKSHSKIIVKQFEHDEKSIELILFKNIYKIPENNKITCSYRVSKNEFNGRVSAQLIINKIYDY
ncbi:single-stranded-DNA-specific exonuclease RecJ [Sulfurimonas sp.]|nr:single-stranded-DNA-specific exonuclease RecJ [Sulfurimonas sp.]